ncbi:MAG: HEAT repeat domain-containing protein, partial [Candidatus Riflebacteria bacterium]|nr:HEAT repeat domain-containing protein [Candidatus Riflebacteria bacterium]
MPTAIELDDPVDPSLPDLKKVTDIGSLLQHIKTLSTQKPSGHVTLLLQLARHVMEEVALTALQALFNLKDRRVPAQIPPMLAEEQYSSQRRFLMLKIIMETDVDLDYAALESILLKEKDVIVKSGLVKVFARSSREQGVGTLVKCLEDEDPRVRANTVEVIEEQNIRGCEQNIVALLEDPENRVKVNAAKYLVKNGYQQAFLTLRTML